MSSCSEISSQLAALSADIAALNNKFALKSDLDKYLSKEEKPQIIQQSVATAEQLWILAIAAGLVKVTELLRPEIEIAANIGKAASEVAGKALGIASKLAPLLPVLNVLLTLAAGGGILAVLGARIDGVEGELSAVSNDLSRTLGLLPPIKAAAEQGKALATQVKKEVDDLSELVGGLSQDILGKVDEKVRAFRIEFTQFVDTKIREVEQKIKTLDTDVRGAIAAVVARVSEIENNLIPPMKNDISALQSDTGAIKSKTEYLTGRIDRTDAKLNEVTDRVNTLTAAVNNFVNLVREIFGNIGELGASLLTEIAKVNARIDRIATPDLSAIQAKIRGLEGAITGIQSKIGSIEGEMAGLKASIPAAVGAAVQALVPPLVGALVPPLLGNLAPPILGNLVPPIVNNMFNNFYQNIVNNITNITNNITNNIVKTDLSEVLAKIDAVPTAVIAAYIASPIVFQRTVTAAATGTCQTAQPGGCIDTAIGRGNNNLFDRLKDLFNTGANAAQLGLLNIINSKLGGQIPELGISGALLRIGSSTIIDRVLNLLTFAATLHNATQLSSNIGVTLIQTMQNVVDFFGLRDGNGEPYDLSSLIGSSIENFAKSIIGEENLTNFKATWAQYSRIYQAGANVFTSLMSMGDSLTQGLQVIGGQTGKIGNALRAWGVVSEKAYTWMNPTPNFSNPLLTKLNSLEETASMVENVSQQPINVKSAKEELEASSKALADSLEQKEKAPQAKPIPEASQVKEQQTEIKTSSKGKDLEDSDLEPDD